METMVLLAVVAWLAYRGRDQISKKSKPRSSYYSTNQTRVVDSQNSLRPNVSSSPSVASTDTRSSEPYSTTGEFRRSQEGFVPADRCLCGGNWIKHVNKENGGRFFGCSRYPTCTNTRDKQINDEQCSNGHRRTAGNTTFNSAGQRRCLICNPPKKTPRPTTSPHSSTQRVANINFFKNNDGYCRNGHLRTPNDTYVRPNGESECKICRRIART